VKIFGGSVFSSHLQPVAKIIRMLLAAEGQNGHRARRVTPNVAFAAAVGSLVAIVAGANKHSVLQGSNDVYTQRRHSCSSAPQK